LPELQLSWLPELPLKASLAARAVVKASQAVRAAGTQAEAQWTAASLTAAAQGINTREKVRVLRVTGIGRDTK